jgi:hypothetical protein
MAKLTAVGNEVASEESKLNFVPNGPNVCLTPAAPSPIPLPYPITTDTSDLVVGCETILHKEKKTMNTHSKVRAVRGNEPGTLGDIVTGVNRGSAWALVGPPTVLFEGAPVATATSSGFGNCIVPGDAPALPAQTPGTFLGGGGSGTTLTGECAEAVADCGLSAIDFAPFDQLIEVVRAAHDRCRDYDDTRWLEEHERAFDHRDVEAQSSQAAESRLRRAPTGRERHLAECVGAPIVHPSFYAQRGGGFPPAYFPPRAPAAPQSRGLTPRLGVNRVFSTLRAELRASDGRARHAGDWLDADVLRSHRDERVAAILLDAQDEDEPRLRSTDLAASIRPRQAESERRALEQELPQPPQIPRASSGEASGAEAAGDDDESASANGPQRQAQGCVGGAAEAQQSDMRRSLREDFTGGFVASQQEAQSGERGSRRTLDRARADYVQALADRKVASFAGDRRESTESEVAERRAAVVLARAMVDQRSASALVTSLSALQWNALELSAGSEQRAARMPDTPSAGPPRSLSCGVRDD